MYYHPGYQQQPMQQQPGNRAPKPARKRSRAWVAAILVLLILAAAIAAAVLYFIPARQANEARQALEAEVSAVEDQYLPNTFVDGINLGGMTAQQGIDAVLNQISARQNSWSLALTYQGHVFYTLNYETLGIHTDISQVYALLQEQFAKGKSGTLDERKQALDQAKAEASYAFTTQSAMTDEHLDSILSQIKQYLTAAPVDAYLAYFYPDENDPFIIQNEIYGSTLDTDKLKTQILSMAAEGQSGALEIVPDRVAPKVTTADVRKQVTLLCKATTPISSASTVDRTSNIRTAFAYINGKTVDSGKTFSFNSATKDRTLENGYKYAIEYQTGMEVMGVGGGVCQASTTVYLAALQSGLEIVKRSSHSDRVSYTTFGQDATVVYGRLDLVFRNNTPGTIYITAHVREVKKNKFETEVCIYGPTLGDNVKYSLRTETVETTLAPLEPTYIADKAHTYVTYKDEMPYLVREARDGFVNETFLQRWEDGVLVSETLVSRDTCKAREAVYYTGTLDREL